MITGIPKEIGKYAIRKELGRGSMGIVYEAYDPFSNQLVAIKATKPSSDEKPESSKKHRRMFLNEIYVAGKLEHPNIVKILDAGTEEKICYIVMELISNGNTLKQYCDPENLLSYQKVVEIMFKCAKALDYAHQMKIIHRDIKPGNILLTEDRDVKICDFGISYLMNEKSVNIDTTLRNFIGSPRYMAPEQIKSDPINYQIDLFSLGIVMYELLTGKYPFSAQRFSKLIYKITNEKYTPLQSYRTNIPSVLKKIVHRALQKTPEKRYKKGLDMAADLSLTFDNLQNVGKALSIQEKINQMDRLDFFKYFSEAEIWEVIPTCVWQEFNTGEKIIIEGEIEDAFFVIISGSVIVRKGDVVIATLLAGDCFGEMGYLLKQERTATIYAKEKVSIVKISDTALERLSISCQLHFNRTFLHTLLQRLSATTNQVVKNHTSKAE